MERDLDIIIEKNIAYIMDALVANGTDHICSSYHGCGDEGSLDQIETPLEKVDVPFLKETGDYYSLDEHGNIVKRVSRVEAYLVEIKVAVSQVTEDIISHFGHEGYGDNSGGRGELTIDAEAGTVSFQHYSTESDSSFFTSDEISFDSLIGPDADYDKGDDEKRAEFIEDCERVINFLKPLNIPWFQIVLDGNGDVEAFCGHTFPDDVDESIDRMVDFVCETYDIETTENEDDNYDCVEIQISTSSSTVLVGIRSDGEVENLLTDQHIEINPELRSNVIKPTASLKF